MPYWRLFYLIWETRDRVPLLDDEAAGLFRKSVHASCKEIRIGNHAIGTMPDHVHLAVSIPPDSVLSTAVGRLAGASVHLLNDVLEREAVFSWQGDYAALFYDAHLLRDVVAYVNSQRERHAPNRL